MALQAPAASAAVSSTEFSVLPLPGRIVETDAEHFQRCSQALAHLYQMALDRATPAQLANFLQDAGACKPGQGYLVAEMHFKEARKFKAAGDAYLGELKG